MSGETQTAMTVEYPEDPLCVVELSLREVFAASRLLGHMSASIEGGDEILVEELMSVRSMLDVAHADISVHWKAAMEEWRAEMAQHREALAAVEAELAAAKAARAAPGSRRDVEQAAACWRLLASAAYATETFCVEAGHPIKPLLPREEL